MSQKAYLLSWLFWMSIITLATFFVVNYVSDITAFALFITALPAAFVLFRAPDDSTGSVVAMNTLSAVLFTMALSFSDAALPPLHIVIRIAILVVSGAGPLLFALGYVKKKNLTKKYVFTSIAVGFIVIAGSMEWYISTHKEQIMEQFKAVMLH